jgi:hypothetical protein
LKEKNILKKQYFIKASGQRRLSGLKAFKLELPQDHEEKQDPRSRDMVLF